MGSGYNLTETGGTRGDSELDPVSALPGICCVTWSKYGGSGCLLCKMGAGGTITLLTSEGFGKHPGDGKTFSEGCEG